MPVVKKVVLACEYCDTEFEGPNAHSDATACEALGRVEHKYKPGTRFIVKRPFSTRPGSWTLDMPYVARASEGGTYKHVPMWFLYGEDDEDRRPRSEAELDELIEKEVIAVL